MSLVAGMVAGADSIDDMAPLRHGAMGHNWVSTESSAAPRGSPSGCNIGQDARESVHMKRLPHASEATLDRLATIRASLPRGLLIAMAGYAVVVVFGLAYVITRSRWPDLDQTRAAIAAVLVAAPLALAFVWDRIASFKVFGFELALTSASMRTEMQVVGAITEQQYFSGKEALVEQITQAIVRPQQELLELNLQGGNYWWSTRLYLVAALADDFSQIQHLVFTEGGAAEAFVGMATPGNVRKALAREWPTLEISYQTIKAEPPSSLSPRRAGTTEQSRLIEGFVAHTFKHDGRDASETNIQVRVDAAKLHDWLNAIGRRLSVDSVDWSGVVGPELVRSLLFQFDGPYVALLRQGRLDRVVNRLDVAIGVGRRALE
jgi:hypothetical protein